MRGENWEIRSDSADSIFIFYLFSMFIFYFIVRFIPICELEVLKVIFSWRVVQSQKFVYNQAADNLPHIASNDRL